MIPELGRFAEEEIGDPLQYSWASLMAQLVNNLPAMQETWVLSLGWEDLLEEGMATILLFLPGESLWTEEPAGYSPWARKELDLTEQINTHNNDM